MAVTGISNGTVLLNLNNATNYVYEVFSTTDLTQPWNIETEVFPGTNTSAMPFTVNQAARGSLFLWARDWTGITSNGNQTPDWWFWYWFGELGLSDTNLDSGGSPLLSDYQNGMDPNVITFSLSVTNQYVNNSNIPIQINVTGGAPCYMAVLVDDTNWADANWIPYASTPLVRLGTNEGWHQIWLNLRGFPIDSQSTWAWYRVKLDTTPPLLVITNPASTNVMQPMIQVQGLCPESLASLTYDLSNAAGLSTNLQAFVISQCYSTNTWESTTNTFQAFDVPLTNGANVLTFHATDLAGNITTTNFTYTLSYASRTNPPVMQLYWPQDGTQISGSNFTIRGCLDDFTTAIQATIIDSNGDTNTASAIVERNGNFWIENLPLGVGDNEVTLTATDVASNVCTTNITVTGSSLVLTMNPIASSQLWQMTEDVSGTISDPTMSVWVNGVEGTNNGDGTWDASGVPTTAGGTAVFQGRAIPNSDNEANVSGSGGMAGYARMADSSSASATDMELSEDRPARLYGSQYNDSYNSYGSFRLYGEPYDVQFYNDYNCTWADGAACTWSGSDADGYLSGDGSPYPTFFQYAYASGYWGEWVLCSEFWSGYYNNTNIQWLPDCWPQEHCDVSLSTNWTGPLYPGVVQSYFDSTFKQNEQLLMNYDAGGKAVPGTGNFCLLNCSAGDGLSTKPILPQSITMGNLGSLDARGNLYVALPSGVTTVVTPQTPGRQWYKFSPTATPIPVTLTANGYDLSQTTPTFCVGQHIAFNLSCPGLPMTNVSCNWTLGGNFVNAASPPNSAGCVTYTKDSSLLQGPHPSCQCWYVNGGSETVNVGLNVVVNGKSLSTAAMGTYSIVKPTITDFQPTNSPPPVECYFLTNNGVSLSAAASFRTYVKPPANFSGTATYAQLIQRSDSYYVSVPLVGATHESDSSAGGFWLDNNYPYALDTPQAFSWTDNPTKFVRHSDNPRLDPGSFPFTNSISITDQFKTYLIFQPTGGIYVTLGRIDWGWSCNATQSNGVWTWNMTTNQAAPDWSDNSFPVWTNIWQNN